MQLPKQRRGATSEAPSPWPRKISSGLVKRGLEAIMRMILTVVALCCTVLCSAHAQDNATPGDANTTSRDLSECKMAAMRLGSWDRDSWYASTVTGQYLIACMTAKGYRRRTVDWEGAYNPLDEVRDQKKPLYRSEEAEFLVKSGCFDDGGDTVNIAIAECWQK